VVAAAAAAAARRALVLDGVRRRLAGVEVKGSGPDALIKVMFICGGDLLQSFTVRSPRCICGPLAPCAARLGGEGREAAARKAPPPRRRPMMPMMSMMAPRPLYHTQVIKTDGQPLWDPEHQRIILEVGRALGRAACQPDTASQLLLRGLLLSCRSGLSVWLTHAVAARGVAPHLCALPAVTCMHRTMEWCAWRERGRT
jgi:hypothetical protein